MQKAKNKRDGGVGGDGFYLPRKRELKTLLFGNEKNYLITILSSFFFSVELEIEKYLSSESFERRTLLPSNIRSTEMNLKVLPLIASLI